MILDLLPLLQPVRGRKPKIVGGRGHGAPWSLLWRSWSPVPTVARMSQRSAEDKYTDPDLRARLKDEVQAGDKGGKPGQWSARKAQLLKHEYEKAGGGYKGGKDETQAHLSQWSQEDWQTSDGSPDASTGDEPEGAGASKRYLPKEAWDELSEDEKRATNAAKAEGAAHGEQHVANTEAAKDAGRRHRDASSPGEPFDGYDGLTAAEVGQRLGDLDEEGLRAVRDYEQAHDERKTVLERVERKLD